MSTDFPNEIGQAKAAIERTLAGLETLATVHDAAVEKARATEAALRERVAALESAAADVAPRMSALEAELEARKKTETAAVAELELAAKREHEVREAASRRVSHLEREMAVTHEEHEEKATRYAHIDAEFDLLREANEFLTSEVDRVSEERDALLREKSELDNELEAEKREKTELKEELEEVSGTWDLDELNARLEAARSERDNLKATVNSLQTKVASSEEGGASAAELRAVFDKEMDMARQIIAQLESQSEAMESKVASYQEQLVQQKKINADLSVKLTKLAKHFQRRGNIVDSVAPSATGRRVV